VALVKIIRDISTQPCTGMDNRSSSPLGIGTGGHMLSSMPI